MSNYIIDNDEMVEKCLGLSNNIISSFRRVGMNVSNGPALVEELAVNFLQYCIRYDENLTPPQRLKAVEFSVQGFTAMIDGFDSMKDAEAKKELHGIFKSTKLMSNMILEGSDQRCSIMIKLNAALASGLQPKTKGLKP